MNTTTIYNAMYEDNYIRRHMGGVFPADVFCFNQNQPGIYIVNSDEAKNAGTHWLVFYLNKDCVEFFDSTGKLPEQYQNYFRTFLNTQVQGYKYSKYHIQQLQTTTCGHFCLYYCYYRSRGKSMEDIIHMLLGMNDNDIRQFIMRHFKSVL